jgi:molybdate transport system ATP-binding protein
MLAEADVPALLVTHDFAEAAELGDEAGIVDAGRIVQRGTASELAARPASSFVADFTGAVVLTGTARATDDGLTAVDLDGGGTVISTDAASGPVAVSVYPWEIELGPATTETTAHNQLPARIATITVVGNRARVALSRPQPLVAEITAASAERLGLKPGDEVVARWKAAATRIVAR